MFSIIIPLYNKELSITKTLQSVLGQIFKDFEVLIINDGSTDKSLEKVKAFIDKRIRIINQENGGVSRARNRGVKEAKYDWIAFLDADDLWMDEHLDTFKKSIDKYKNQKVFSNSYIDSNAKLPKKMDDSVMLIDNYFNEASKRQFFWTSVSCINRQVFDNVGFFDETLSRGEDLELWTRIARIYNFVNSKKITAIYRLDAENRSDLQFDLTKSRIYKYNFKEATSEAEIKYYKKSIIIALRGFLRKGGLNDFKLLYRKNKKYIRMLDVLKPSK